MYDNHYTMIRKSIFFTFFILIALAANCQKSVIDSLEQYYYYSVDEKRMEICLQLAGSYRNMDPAKGIDYAREGIELAREYDKPHTEAQLLNESGMLFRKIGELDKSLMYHQEALDLFLQLDDEMGIAFCYSNIANANLDMGYFDRALEYAMRSLEMKEKLGDKNQIAYTMRVIASIYHESGDHEKALPFYEKSYEMYADVGNVSEQANVLLSKANLMTTLPNDFNEKDARAVFENAANVYRETGNNLGVAIVLFHQAEWEEFLSNYSAAETIYLQAEQIALQLHSRIILLKIMKGLSNMYDEMEQYEKAYDYLKRYEALQEEIFTEKTAKTNADLESRILLHEQETEISLLQTQRKTRNSFLLVTALLLTALIVSLVMAIRRYKETKQINEKLNREVIQRRQSEIQLRDSKEQLVKLIEDKNRLMGIVSHDLRSPFSGMHGLLELLDQEYDHIDSNKKREMIHKLHNSAVSIHELLEDLLSWASYNSEKIPFNPVNLKLSDVIDEVNDVYAERASNKNIALETNSVNAIVFADRNMLKTILMNLISNAIKFSYQNSSVIIKAFINNNDHKVVIQVVDTGTGVAPEMKQQMVTPQKFTSSPGTAGEKGSGVGLMLVHELLEKHDSKLIINSTKGEGTVMSFELLTA